MATDTENGRLLAISAKAKLSSLGCKRVRRTQMWIADEGFWVVVIEFQPSDFSKGSYLNVGAMWLWDARPHWSFDYGGRVGGLKRHEDATQFATTAMALADRAADEVRKLRRTFASLSDVARHLVAVAESRSTIWCLFHAAVAAGLARDMATSERLFGALIDRSITHEWEMQLRVKSEHLFGKVTRPESFQRTVLSIIEQSRIMHRLPPDPSCLDRR